MVEHVNILKTVFQEMTEGQREGKMVLYVFHSPCGKRSYILWVTLEVWKRIFGFSRAGLTSRKDKDGIQWLPVPRLGFGVIAVYILRVDDEPPLCRKLLLFLQQ